MTWRLVFCEDTLANFRIFLTTLDLNIGEIGILASEQNEAEKMLKPVLIEKASK